jgi:hypothetical protein
MAVVSPRFVAKKIGTEKKRKVLRYGSVALFFLILHFIFIEIKPLEGFSVRPYGIFFLIIAIGALYLVIINRLAKK